MVIALEAESIFGFVDDTGLKPETVTDEFIKLKGTDSMVFAWTKNQKLFQSLKVETEVVKPENVDENVGHEGQTVGFGDYYGPENEEEDTDIDAVCEDDIAIVIFFCETALKNFQRSVHLSPRFSYTHTLCGHEYVALEDFENGIKSYQNALRIDSKNLYGTPIEFATDVKLTFNNAMLYNPKHGPVHGMAVEMLGRFEEFFRPVHEKIDSSFNQQRESEICGNEDRQFQRNDEFLGNSWSYHNQGQLNDKNYESSKKLKDNEDEDEDIDDDMPTTSFPPVEIEKDDGACMVDVDGSDAMVDKLSSQVGISWYSPHESHLRGGVGILLLSWSSSSGNLVGLPSKNRQKLTQRWKKRAWGM